MRSIERKHLVAWVASVGLHVLAIWWVGGVSSQAVAPQPVPKELENLVLIDIQPPPSLPAAPLPPPRPTPTNHGVAPKPVAQTAVADRPRAYMDAPPAPTAQEWAQAGTYTLKNSKRYRHTWGQQVRSMMGTAVEGPDVGLVRFRIEIAPDGTLARLDTLWSTSDKAETLARKAVETMPRLPPTPTGKPLIFEKTISFQPFDSDGPPIYKNDCIPDPPGYRNPFAWDGKSPQAQAAQAPAEKPDPQAMAECLKQLPQDSIEAESAHNQRQLEQWGASRLTQTEVPRR